MAVDLAQRSVAANFCGHDHAIEPFDLVDNDRQRLRHDDIHCHLRAGKNALDLLDRLRNAGCPLLGQVLGYEQNCETKFRIANSRKAIGTTIPTYDA